MLRGTMPGPALRTRSLTGDDFAAARAVADDWFGRPVGLTLHRLFFEQLGPYGVRIDPAGGPDRLLGVLLGLPSALEPDLAYVHMHMVDPAMRGRGIGALLYRTFGDAMAARGCTRIRALAAPSNTVSVRFHEALGFTGRLSPGHVGPGQDRIVFERPLPLDAPLTTG